MMKSKNLFGSRRLHFYGLAAAFIWSVIVVPSTESYAQQEPCRFLVCDDSPPQRPSPQPVPAPAPPRTDPPPQRSELTRRCVTNVRADDVLWIRSSPSASSTKVGHIPPGACGVFVNYNTCNGAWCRVEFGSSSGWSNTAFLK
jgi:hypothetical protein